MPQTVASGTLAIVLLGFVVLACYLGTRRWGTGPAPDPVAQTVRGYWETVSWGRPALFAASDGGDEERRRRRFFRRRTETDEAEEAPAAGAESLGAAEVDAGPDIPEEAPLPDTRPHLDHVPFGGSGGQEDADEELRFRQRFRRGLRKTRDYLNRDVREVFGAGPIQESFDDLEEVLVRSDIGVATAAALSDELRERGRELTSDTLPDALRDSMRGLLKQADRRLRVNPGGLSLWLVVGVNGTGKTTSIAKLARHARAQGFNVLLAAADTFRAAAIEQLQTWGERLDIPVIAQQAGSDPAAVVFDAIAHGKARGYDLVIVDTAGRLHTRKPLMEELRKVRRVVDREEGALTECFLVLDATTGQNGIAQARAFSEAVDVTGLVLAKLDGTAKGGIVFAVERELGIPVKAVGLGEGADDLAPFEPDRFVDALFDASDED